MLTINKAGSVSKTSDTWGLTPNMQVSTASILGIGIVPIPIFILLEIPVVEVPIIEVP